MDVPSIIDHTLLKADATPADIQKLCQEAAEYGFCSVCVNPVNVKDAVKFLKGTDVKVCTVLGFPLGADLPETKVFQAVKAFEQGCQEVDMVINIGAVKSGNFDIVEKEIKELKSVAADRIIKVILETCYLSDVEKIRVAWLAAQCGADFVKTSTGFGPEGASAVDVKLLRQTVGPDMGVKASGGIRDLRKFILMVNAGANRIGASSSVKIMKEWEAYKNKMIPGGVTDERL